MRVDGELVPEDFVDLLTAFANASVRYLVVGGDLVDARRLEALLRK